VENSQSANRTLCVLLACPASSSDRRLEAVCSSETSVTIYQITWRHIPGKSILQVTRQRIKFSHRQSISFRLRNRILVPNLNLVLAKLRAGQSQNWGSILGGSTHVSLFHSDQTDSEAHRAYYLMGTASNAAGAGS
jgi:hypothetical protein